MGLGVNVFDGRLHMANSVAFLVGSSEGQCKVCNYLGVCAAAGIERGPRVNFLSQLKQLRQRLKEIFEFCVFVDFFFHGLRYLAFVQVDGTNRLLCRCLLFDYWCR